MSDESNRNGEEDIRGDEDVSERPEEELPEAPGSNEEVESEETGTNNTDLEDLSNVVKQERKMKLPKEVMAEITEYIDLQNVIRKARDDLKVTRQRIKELETKIKGFMIEHDVPMFKLASANIERVEKKSTKAISKEYLKGVVAEIILDDDKIIEVVEAAFTKRPVTYVEKLKLTRQK